jgi:hypothetical protein
MKYLSLSVLLLGCPLAVQAEDKAPQCLSEKIDIAKLQQQNAQLVQQLMQLQFGSSQEAAKNAKAEQERLEKLLPPPLPEKKPEEKK